MATHKRDRYPERATQAIVDKFFEDDLKEKDAKFKGKAKGKRGKPSKNAGVVSTKSKRGKAKSKHREVSDKEV